MHLRPRWERKHKVGVLSVMLGVGTNWNRAITAKCQTVISWREFQNLSFTLEVYKGTPL